MKSVKLLKLLVVTPVAIFYIFAFRVKSAAITLSVGADTDSFTTTSHPMIDLLITNPFELIFTHDLLMWFDGIYIIPWLANPVIFISIFFLFKNRYRTSICCAVISFLFAAWFVVNPHYFNVYQGIFHPAKPLIGYYYWLATLGIYSCFLVVLYLHVSTPPIRYSN